MWRLAPSNVLPPNVLRLVDEPTGALYLRRKCMGGDLFHSCNGRGIVLRLVQVRVGMRLRNVVLLVMLALALSSGPAVSSPEDEIIERWHEEATRGSQEQRADFASQPVEALPTRRGRGWRERFRGLNYGVTEQGIKWMDAKGTFTTSTPYGSQMCAVIEDARYCF
jgi:hypothetical protein